MSEKIYALLFRLFPSRFRALWHDDALDLIRQRAEHERGLIPQVRLWYDLLFDLALSLPAAWLREDPAPSPAREPSTTTGLPSFHTLEQPPIRSSSFFYATLGTIFAAFVLISLSRHAGHFPLRQADPLAESRGVTMDPWATGPSTDGGTGSTEVIGSGHAAGKLQGSASRPATSVIHLRTTPSPALFDANERRHVIDGISAILTQRYPDHAAAQRLASSLKTSDRFGRYNNLDDPNAFAAALTTQLRATSGDMHFTLEFSAQPISSQAAHFINDSVYRTIMRQANCGIQDAKILPHSIGFLKINTFPDPEICADMARSAMNTVSRGNALIIDLRDNSGGSPDMVRLLAGWLFDRPAFLYNPRENSEKAMWTSSRAGTSNFANKPVYVLTSSRTYSAAEQFTYDLKMLHRATIVGERTAGATDTGTFHRIDDHFGIALRESTVPNPYSEPDWTVIGVTPDVPTNSSDALRKAQALAGSR